MRRGFPRLGNPRLEIPGVEAGREDEILGSRNPRLAPCSCLPLTASPLTASPLTASPLTASPLTASPLTASPLTASPLTASLLTAAPLTASPLTASPLTASPLTASPLTASPLTASPLTAAPLTASPLMPLPSLPLPSLRLPSLPLPSLPLPKLPLPSCLSPHCPSPHCLSPHCLSPHASPLTASPLNASPLTASPLTASPLTASPLTAAPLTASPLTASPLMPLPSLPLPSLPLPSCLSPHCLSPHCHSPHCLSPHCLSPHCLSPHCLSHTTQCLLCASVELYFLLPFVYCVTNPLYLPFALAFYMLAFVIYRNQFINVYCARYEMAGAFWPHFHARLVAAMLVQQVALVGILLLKDSRTQAWCLLPLPFVTLIFHYAFIDGQFTSTFSKLALEEANRKDTIDRTVNPNENPHSFLARAYLHPSLQSAFTLLDGDEEEGGHSDDSSSSDSDKDGDEEEGGRKKSKHADRHANVHLVPVKRHPFSTSAHASPAIPGGSDGLERVGSRSSPPNLRPRSVSEGPVSSASAAMAAVTSAAATAAAAAFAAARSAASSGGAFGGALNSDRGASDDAKSQHQQACNSLPREAQLKCLPFTRVNWSQS
ncbi:hypothetical protein CLOP_g10395 [Closterium sp. NIES-67]|nr:hypothetical protein CLOP_g10395 [Closterium sp. NIES-67]